MTGITSEAPVTEANSTTPPERHSLELGFFSKKKKIYVGNFTEASPDVLKLSDDTGFEYRLDKPIFVDTITIEASKTRSPKIKYEVQTLNSDGFFRVEPEHVSEDSDGRSVCKVNDFVIALRIRSNRTGFFSSTEVIRKIKIDHLSFEDLANYTDLVSRFEKLEHVFLNKYDEDVSALKAEQAKVVAAGKSERDDLAKMRQELEEDRETQESDLAEMKVEVAELETKKTETEAATSKAKKDLESVRGTLSSAQGEQKALDTKVRDLKITLQNLSTSVDEKSAEIKLKTTQAAELNDKLQHLNNDVSLFADDAAGFGRQVDSQNRKYMAILYCILGATAVLTLISIASTWEIYNDYVKDPKLSIWSLISIKSFLAPFILSAYGLLYKLGRPILNEVIANNKRRLEMSRVSILCKDTSDSGTLGLDISPGEKLNIRMTNRMTLMREVLSGKYDDSREHLKRDGQAFEPFTRDVTPRLADPGSQSSEKKTDLSVSPP